MFAHACTVTMHTASVVQVVQDLELNSHYWSGNEKASSVQCVTYRAEI